MIEQTYIHMGSDIHLCIFNCHFKYSNQDENTLHIHIYAGSDGYDDLHAEDRKCSLIKTSYLNSHLRNSN